MLPDAFRKPPLSPLYKREDESTVAVESAINTARIDGIWFAMGLLEQKFSYDELLHMYVSLSYKADVRIEKKGKVELLIDRSQDDYAAMLKPIIDSFIENSLIVSGDGGFEKAISLPRKEVIRRLKQLRTMTFVTNYLKNTLTAGLANGLYYALQKIIRSADSHIHPPTRSSSP